jgi:IS30 family transposase
MYPGRSLPPRLANYGPGKVIDPKFLSEDERVQIADLDLAGVCVRAIARELGRAPSTISRELRRNSDTRGGHYRPHAAQRRAWQRRARPKVSKLAAQPTLRERVQHYLGALRWSPEQISARLRRDRPDDPTMNVSHETIAPAGPCANRVDVPTSGSRGSSIRC